MDRQRGGGAGEAESGMREVTFAGGGGRQGALQEGREEQKKDKVSVAITGSTHTRRAGVEARAREGVTLAAAAPRALLCNWHTGASTAQPVFGYIIVTERGGG